LPLPQEEFMGENQFIGVDGLFHQEMAVGSFEMPVKFAKIYKLL